MTKKLMKCFKNDTLQSFTLLFMLNLIGFDMISCWYIWYEVIWFDVDIYPLIVDVVIIIYFNTRWWRRWRELFMIIPRHLSDLVCEIKYRNHENLTSRFYIELAMMSAFSYWYPPDNNITTGKIYQHVINKERRGDYLGKTVQVGDPFIIP